MHQTRNKISSDHSAKPPMSSFLLPVLLLAATAATADNSLPTRPGCQVLCGGVEIPYPFGIGTNCSRSGFEIDCINNGSTVEIPVLANIEQTIRVLHLSVWPFPEAQVLHPVAYKCYNSTGYDIGSSKGGANFNPEGVYRISNTTNELYVLGCNTLAYVSGGRNVGATGFRYNSYTGCIAVAGDRNDPQDDACAGVGCCQVNIPEGVTDSSMTWNSWSRSGQEFCPCDYAFVVEKGNYTFKASDLLSTQHIPNNQTMPWVVDWTVPLRLDWAIRDNGSTPLSCSQAPTTTTDHQYACRSHWSECVDSTNGPGYFCNCTKGYKGNPYVVGGCTNIDECERTELNSCPSGSTCIDTEGGYECRCKFGRSGEDCHPIISQRATIAISATFVGILVLALILWFSHIDRKRRMKAAFFDKNGGKILMGAAGINIFTEKQLEKMTNHYQTLIGQGAFGKVFQGTTDEKQLVAVKRSNNEGKDVGKRDNLQQGDDIVNEITFQFGNSHHNLVRLVGCCLETNIPVLVFEFISKGSIHKMLHEEPHEFLSLPSRLHIAIGSAEALSYIHSNGDRIHGDIKSANILLNDNLEPKVSDFGSSKILSVDMYARAVAADMSYIDPVYMKTEHFVAKSDVYSFSVVLLELITRKTVKYGENKINSLPVNFVKCYKEKGNGREMYDRDILAHGDGVKCQHCVECLDKIGTLAVRCLKEDVDERPTMAEVVKELKEAAKVLDKCAQIYLAQVM